MANELPAILRRIPLEAGREHGRGVVYLGTCHISRLLPVLVADFATWSISIVCTALLQKAAFTTP